MTAETRRRDDDLATGGLQNVADLPPFFRGRYRDFPGSLEATADQIERELAFYRDLKIGKSSNQEVLGCMSVLANNVSRS